MIWTMQSYGLNFIYRTCIRLDGSWKRQTGRNKQRTRGGGGGGAICACTLAWEINCNPRLAHIGITNTRTETRTRSLHQARLGYGHTSPRRVGLATPMDVVVDSSYYSCSGRLRLARAQSAVHPHQTPHRPRPCPVCAWPGA